MTVHKCFEKNIHSLLLECSSSHHKYYRLNDMTEEILPIIIDTSFSPISFYTDDTLFLWDKTNNKYFFYNITSSIVSEITSSQFPSILAVLLQDSSGRVTFNSALTECIYWNRTCILRVKFGKGERQSTIDTLITVQASYPITHVFCLSDSIFIINRFDIPKMKESSFLFEAKKDCAKINKCSFLIDDYLNGRCIAWNEKDGNCYVCRFDSNTLKLEIIMSISASVNLYGRLGFLSDNTIAWYTGIDLDYSVFVPLLNQQNLLKIVN
jgi:hypothetical protein